MELIESGKDSSKIQNLNYEKVSDNFKYLGAM